jgi:hypothetical protein
MAKLLIGLGLLYLSAGVVLVAATKEPPAPPKNVVLIGWDAADRRNIKEYWDTDMLPNLKQLASEGTIVAMDITRFTDTKAGWVQILTGYAPEKTGTYSNERYKSIPRGWSIFERLEKHFGPENIVTVAVIGKKHHVDADAPKYKKLGKKALAKLRARQAKQNAKKLIFEDQPMLPNVVEQDGGHFIETPGKPYYRTKEGMDVFINGLRFDQVVGKKTLELLEKYKDQRFFFFVHFAEIDHKGHRFGEDSKKQRGAYRSADKWTGKIMDKIKELGLYDDTLIYVTSDHGFMKVGRRHWDAPHVFMATNDAGVMRRGDRVDVTPTILDRYGLDLDSFDPPFDGHSLLRPYTPPIW